MPRSSDEALSLEGGSQMWWRATCGKCACPAWLGWVSPAGHAFTCNGAAPNERSIAVPECECSACPPQFGSSWVGRCRAFAC